MRYLSLRARRTLIWKRIKYNWSVNLICTHFRINRDTFYYHWNSYLKNGWDGLAIKSRRPHTVHKTPDNVIDKVIEIRKNYGWNPVKIEQHLLSRGIRVSHGTIYKIICREGLNNPLDYVRKTWGKRRFEREHSNSLWQADWKLCNEDDYWMISFLDDHSRFITNSDKFWEPDTENAIRVLEKAIKRNGLPKQIVTDKGSQFHNNQSDEPSEFTQFCIDNSIEHITASKRRPTTIGKIEAFHKAYDKEYWITNSHKKFIHYWNYERPHGGISYLIPCQVYIVK